MQQSIATEDSMDSPVLRWSYSVDDFISWPVDVKDGIYQAVFNGTILTPLYHVLEEGKSYDEILRHLYEASPLSLLLFSKAEYRTVQEALLKSATIRFESNRTFSVYDLQIRTGHLVKHIQIDFLGNERTPLALMNKVLGSMTNLETVHFHLGLRKLDFKHKTFLEEVADPESRLSRCLTPYIKHQRWTVQWDEGFDVLEAMLNKHSFAGQTTAPRVLATFLLTTRSCKGTVKGLENFDITATFDSSTWTVTGSHAGQRFCISQKPLEHETGSIEPAGPEYEREMHEIMARYFPVVKMTPGLNVCLFMVMSEAHDKDLYGSGSTWDNLPYNALYRAHAIGEAIVRIDGNYKDHDCRSESEQLPLAKEQIWGVWRQILQIGDASLVSKEWKPDWKLQKVRRYGPGRFDSQLVFFSKLWGISIDGMLRETDDEDYYSYESGDSDDEGLDSEDAGEDDEGDDAADGKESNEQSDEEDHERAEGQNEEQGHDSNAGGDDEKTDEGNVAANNAKNDDMDIDSMRRPLVV